MTNKSIHDKDKFGLKIMCQVLTNVPYCIPIGFMWICEKKNCMPLFKGSLNLMIQMSASIKEYRVLLTPSIHVQCTELVLKLLFFKVIECFFRFFFSDITNYFFPGFQVLTVTTRIKVTLYFKVA